MKLKSIQIKNFKKLKDVTINMSDDQSIFVGANNSGKTSAMEAISKFLKRTSRIEVYDFTIYNWPTINEKLEEINNIKKKLDLQEVEDNELLENDYFDAKKKLEELFPSLKTIISVDESELHKVIEIIPGLDNEIKEVAVYFRFEPENYDLLFKEYIKARKRIEDMSNLDSNSLNLEDMEKVIKNQWPRNFQDFLSSEGQLRKHFSIRAYLANPAVHEIEFLFDESTELQGNPLERIIKVDEIHAQRGLSDKEDDENISKIKKLSKQFTKYYKKFEVKKEVSPSEMDLLNANLKAEQVIKDQLDQTMSNLIKPLMDFGYPGFGSPHIKVAPIIDVIETMDNESSVLFNVHPKNAKEEHYYLPERNNGLGFQNLISIFFELIYFIKERHIESEKEDSTLKALHLILIEEPEAHLHAQAQKVFVENAMNIIKEKEEIGLYTQLVMSTHSSHIAEYANFDDLLYFKRKINEDSLHEVEVINLENIKMDNTGRDDNKKFVERYLQLAAHDIFFADGIIMIEGAGERILLPRMIKKDFPGLGSKYITIMEVGGAYAHKFFNLINCLERPTLIITDIDSVEQKAPSKKWTKTHTSNKEKLKTSNETLKNWFSKSVTIKELLTKNPRDKEKDFLKVAYQTENHATSRRAKAYSRTFEDDFAMSNKSFFGKMKHATGLCKVFKDILTSQPKIDSSISKKLFVGTEKGKTQFALDIIYGETSNSEEFNTPKYIYEGLCWLDKKLNEEIRGEK